jgi:translation initiation factor 2 gamma subunit (eIF-2gamma)
VSTNILLLLQVQKLTAGEQLFVNVGASQVGGRVMAVKGDLAKIALTAPACAQAGDKVALSRRIDKHWRLVGKSLCCLFKIACSILRVPF